MKTISTSAEQIPAQAPKQNSAPTRAHMPPHQALFYNMSLVGGFFGGYAVMRCLVLGSAQTSNFIHLIGAIFSGDYMQAAICLGAAVVYAVAIVLAKLSADYLKPYAHLLAVILDFVGVAAVTLIPEDTNFILTLYPIFFVTAFQWNVFPGALGYASACIFSSNNYRQMIVGTVTYFETRDPAALKKARFFAGTLLWFHIGVVAAFASDVLLSDSAALGCIVLLVPSLVMVIIEMRRGAGDGNGSAA